MTDYDQVSRRMAKLRPVALLQLLLTEFPLHLRYRGWVDARTITWPGDPERTGDVVAVLEALATAGPPWACALEFQLQPDPDMFGRLLVFLGLVWLEKRPDALPGSRYQLAAAVVNLTGTSASLPASCDMVLPGPDGLCCALKVREVYLREWSAEAIQAGIASGQIDPLVLAWIPLMHATDVAAVLRQWLDLWARETDETFARELVSMTRVFAELSDERARWLQALEGLGMVKSPFMESLRQEGRKEGQLLLLRDQLTERFGTLSPQTVERLQARSLEELTALGRALMHAASLRDLGLE